MNNLFKICIENVEKIFNNDLNNKNHKNHKNHKKKIDNRILWEYGKSGVKIKNFNKAMGKNLAILYYIDYIFQDFIFNDLDIKLNQNPNNNFSNKKGSLSWINSSLIITINKVNLSGKYNIIDAGYSVISDITITNDILNKNKIPPLDLILEHIDNAQINNIKYINKLVNILSLSDKYTITDNSMSDFNLSNIISLYLSDITELVNDKHDILKSSSSSIFYIKIYSDHSKAFFIDKDSKLIYYISTVENHKNNKIYFFYYVLNVNHKFKIKPIVE